MHSRRPPALRHKGNWRELQKNRKQQQPEPNHDIEQQQQQQQHHQQPNSATATIRKKRKSGQYCSRRTLMLVCITLALGLYAKFVLTSASTIEKGVRSAGAIRGSKGTHDSLAGNVAVQETSKEDDTKKGKDILNSNKELEVEEQKWKDLVKEQTTKKAQAGQAGQVV